MIMYEFKCPDCGALIESLERSDTREIPCRVCAGTAKRIVSAVRCKLDGTSGDFPGEALKWERRHERTRSTD